jgi:hypothetical protein
MPMLPGRPLGDGGPTRCINEKFGAASAHPTRACYFCTCLKYLRSGGGWSFLVGMSRPSLLL